MAHKPERHDRRRRGNDTDKTFGRPFRSPETRPGSIGLLGSPDTPRPGGRFATHPGANSARHTRHPEG
jgi:hypothetical protein